MDGIQGEKSPTLCPATMFHVPFRCDATWWVLLQRQQLCVHKHCGQIQVLWVRWQDPSIQWTQTTQKHFFYFLSLLFAVELASRLQHPAPKEWQQVAENLKIPFDEESQYHPEYDGYTKGYYCIPVSECASVRVQREMSVGNNNTNSQMVECKLSVGLLAGHPVKQADTVMLGYPLGLTMTPEVRRNDLETYEAVTDPRGPAMTWVRKHSRSWFDLWCPGMPVFTKFSRVYLHLVIGP